jgi:hypothetical protein
MLPRVPKFLQTAASGNRLSWPDAGVNDASRGISETARNCNDARRFGRCAIQSAPASVPQAARMSAPPE